MRSVILGLALCCVCVCVSTSGSAWAQAPAASVPPVDPREGQGTAGGLASRDVAPEEGGRLRASVRVKGQPREGAFCRMLDVREPVSTGRQRGPLPMVYEGRTDGQGICRTQQLPPGSYLFTVGLGEGQASLERSVTLANGVESEEDFSFAEIRVHGAVTRKDAPAPGFEVSVVERNEALDILMRVAQATTGQDGTYEVTLPKPGRYTFYLFAAPKSLPVSSQEVSVEEEGETAVDFSLEKAAVRGKAVDEEGRPVEGPSRLVPSGTGPHTLAYS